MSQQSPAAGDVLIARRPGDGRYEISVVPGQPQLTVALQHEAVRHARAFADLHGGTVWMANGAGFVRLASSAPQQT
jgi:hypothetical protein